MTRWLSLFMVVACGCSSSGASDGAGGSSSDATDASVSSTSVATSTAAGGCVEGPAIADNPACEACQNDSCCVTGKSCIDNPECLAIETCARAAGSTAGCYSAHPDGVWDWSGLETCRKNHCSEECGNGAGACGNIIPSPASCTAAVNAKCCDVTTTCGNNDACLALIYQCLDKNNCSTQACVNDCKEAFPDGKADFEALDACWQTVSCL